MIEKLLLISVQASVLILAVLVLRLFLNKTHKRFTYFMWMLVLLRLCLPIQIESPMGIFKLDMDKSALESPFKDDMSDISNDEVIGNTSNNMSGNVSSNNDLEGTVTRPNNSQIDTNLGNNANNNADNQVNNNIGNNVSNGLVDSTVDNKFDNITNSGDSNNVIPNTDKDNVTDNIVNNDIVKDNDSDLNTSKVSKDSFDVSAKHVIVAVWITGMAIVTIVVAIQLFKLKRRLKYAINVESNVWETDATNTALVLGAFRAKIFIPTNISLTEREHILSHERMHIKHGDHIVRVVMLIANIVYWWNPLVWVATYFMKKDMEMLCDESVIKGMESDKRGEYLTALLNCSAKNSGILPVMLFGESNTENRIKHIINLKEPKLYIMIVLAMFVVVCASCCTQSSKVDTSENVTENEETDNSDDENSIKDDNGINTEPLGNQNNNGNTNTNTNVSLNSTMSNKNENLPFECGKYAAVDIDNPRYMEINKYYLIMWDTTKFWEGQTVGLEGIYYYKYFYYDVKDGVINVYTDINKDTIAFQMNVVDEFTIEFEGKQYMLYEKWYEQNYSDESDKDYDGIEYGVYLPEDEDCNVYIVIDKYNVTLYDISKVHNDEPVEYFLNCGDRFKGELDIMGIRSDYEFIDEYYYDMGGNRILAYKHDIIKNVQALYIKGQYSFEYNGVKYVHREKSSRSDSFVTNKTGYQPYDELIGRLVDIYNNCSIDERFDAIDELNIADVWNYESSYINGGFYLLDLDGNGIEELLLGVNQDYGLRGEIYDIYTIDDNELVKIGSGGGRYRYRLCENNIIINEGSSGAANRHFEISKCNGDKLELIKYLDMDDRYYVDGEFVEGGYTELDENYKIKRYLTEEEFFNTIYSYTCIPIEFTLFETMVK